MTRPGEIVEDLDCPLCHPDANTVVQLDPQRHCPTRRSDNSWPHGKPCYYCGEPIDNLSATPSQWNCGPLCHGDQPGVVRPHHVGCVADRLYRYDVMRKASGYEVGFKQIKCVHTWVASEPRRQEIDGSSRAKCSQCGFNAKLWYCPSSPTHLCDYDFDEDPCADSCLHCGQPEERK